MLNREQIRFHRRGDRIHPDFLPLSPEALETAAELLTLYADARDRGGSRGELAAPAEALVKGRGGPAGAFLKLIDDASTYTAAAEMDYPALRDRLLRLSGALWKRGASAEERAAALAAEPELAAFAQGDIYGDLPENETLTAIPDWTPEEVVRRYNLALVQGLLLNAGELVVTIPEAAPAELRRLFKYLKFFRLLTELRRRGDGVEMTISGPFALFENTRKYGLQLASFFPAVPLLKRWQLAASIRWEKRDLRLKLDESCGLVSHFRNFSAYVPEEIALFIRLFRAKSERWQPTGETPLLDLGEGRIAFPDFSFRAGDDGPRVHLELFHRWHRRPLAERLAFLSEHPETPLVIGIDRALADDDALSAMQAAHPELAPRLFLFRDFPGVDRVLKTLEAWEAGLNAPPKRRRGAAR